MRSLLVFTLLALACNSSPREPKAEAAATGSVAAVPSAGGKVPERFGDAIKTSTRQSLSEVLSAPDGYAGKTVLVEGHVRRACSRKGCWMELAASSDASAPGCRVTFKDYGFFVPTDSAGASARVEAAVEVASLEPRHVAHMESEGASFRNKRPDGSADEVRLVATGVELWR